MIKLKEYLKRGGKIRLGTYITDYKKPILNFTYQIVSSGQECEIMLSVCLVGSSKPCYTAIDEASNITEEQIEDLLIKFNDDFDINQVSVLEPDDIINFYKDNKKIMQKLIE